MRHGFDRRFKLVLEQYNKGGLSLRAAAKELGVGAATFSQLIKK